MEKIKKRICRMCLAKVGEGAEFHVLDNLSDLKLEFKLFDIIPEIDLSVTPNAISCKPCTHKIQEMHEFKQMCLNTENIIRNLEDSRMFNSIGSIKELFKLEKQDSDIIDEHFIEINTDLPVCIEESKPVEVLSNVDNKKVSTDLPVCNKEPKSVEVLQVDNKKINTNLPVCFEESKSVLEIDNKKITQKPATSQRKKLWKCKDCNYSSTYLNYKRHLLTHSNKQIYNCGDCNYKTQHMHNLNRHCTTQSHQKQEGSTKNSTNQDEAAECLKCDKCKFSTQHQNLFKRHLLRHDNKKMYKCSNFKTQPKHNLNLHCATFLHGKLAKSTSETNTNQVTAENFKCDKCKYVTQHGNLYKRHILKHCHEKLHKCDICNYKTKHRCNLKRHYATLLHQQKQQTSGESTSEIITNQVTVEDFKCYKCEFSTQLQDLFKQHLLKHINSNYKTEQKQQQKVTKKSSQNYIDGKCYSCDKCKYSSYSLALFKSHLIKHNSEKPFKCDQCAYASRYKQNLVKHSHKHAATQSYNCTLCDFSSDQIGILTTHMLMHTKEKSYSVIDSCFK